MAKSKKSDEKPQMGAFWHATSHIMADAVKRLRPGVKLAIGPSIDSGFYYDFDTSPFNSEDLEKIEKEMNQIIRQNLEFKHVYLKRNEAEKLLKDQPYKLELLSEIKGEKISFYQHNEFMDLCSGPLIKNSSEIKAIKLLNTAGAYWRGDSSKPMLQRIYGISFRSEKELDEFLRLKEESEKRDHRKLGKELGIFMISEYSLAGCPILLPKGTVIYNELMSFLRQEYKKRGYQEVLTPQVFKKEMWETSGHWQHYKDYMFTFKINDRDYSLKPMNCPSNIFVYKNEMRSYKDLPLRIADFGVLHRNELGGVLGGMTRVVKFSQDDAHIFVAPEQIEDEIIEIFDFVKYVYDKVFKFNYKVKLSTRPKDFMGDKKLWDQAEKDLSSALKKAKIDFEIQEGEGAFYGPKIDIIVEDSLKRDWQLATIQLDFQLPLKFDVNYEGKDNQKHKVVMIHRAILGSLERFMGLLIEHYAGAFPTWLAPVQVKLLNLTDDNLKYAKKIEEKLKEAGLRVETDYASTTVQSKIRDAAKIERVPYILVVGGKEEVAGTVAVRTRDGKVKYGVKTEDFIKEICTEISDKK